MKKTMLLLAAIFTGFMSRSQQMQTIGGSTVSHGFIENKGQIRDQNGRPNNSVAYLFNSGSFNMELTKNGFSYEVFTVVRDRQMDEAGFIKPNDADSKPGDDERIASSHRVDVEFIGKNEKAVMIPSHENSFHYNFYIAPVDQHRIENVKSFQQVTYKDLYPNIDMVVSADGDEDNTELKYEFYVHPGGDVRTIKMKYHGASDLSFNESGALSISLVNGKVTESKPYCYLDGSSDEVMSAVVMNGSTASFKVEDYDRSKTLVIDPSIIWGTYYGGDNTEDVAEVAVDTDNKPSIGGNTLSQSNIATAGAYQTTSGGGYHDFFIAKFNADGGLEWATYLGGAGRDLGFGISVDNFNNIYFNGKTTSDGIATSGAHQTIRGGNDDAVIAKFNTNGGALYWCTYMGGTGNEQYRAFVFDPDNNFYVCGYTESPNNISTPGAYQEVYAGGGDGFITKWTPDGVVIWSTYYGAAGQDRYHGITTDLSGDLYITGTTSSTTSITTPGVFQENYGGGDADLWLTKFTEDGNLIWSTLYGGEGHDRGRGVETDSAGNVFVAGFTNSTIGISTPGAVQETWSPGYDDQTNEGLDDNLLFRITPDGTTRIWGTYYGGDAKEELWGMNIDRKQKALYIVGSSQSESMIAYGNAWQPVKGKGSDAIFAKWTYDGAITYGSYFGNDDGEQFEDVEIDQNSDIYLVGKTEANRLPATYGVYQTHSNGGAYDGVLYKFYGGIACRDLNEPNNSFTNAKLIYARTLTDSLVYGYDGNLRNNSDKDYFKFTVVAGFKHHFIELTGLSHNYNLRVFNSAQVLKAISNNSGLTADTVVANNLTPGDYYIQVVAGAPAEYDTLKCYHLNLIKSSTRFPANGSGNRMMPAGAVSDLRLSPNPAAVDVTLDMDMLSDSFLELSLLDQMGRPVFVKELYANEGPNEFTLPVSKLASGIYVVQVKSDHISRSLLLVKE